MKSHQIVIVLNGKIIGTGLGTEHPSIFLIVAKKNTKKNFYRTIRTIRFEWHIYCFRSKIISGIFFGNPQWLRLNLQIYILILKLKLTSNREIYTYDAFYIIYDIPKNFQSKNLSKNNEKGIMCLTLISLLLECFSLFLFTFFLFSLNANFSSTTISASVTIGFLLDVVLCDL